MTTFLGKLLVFVRPYRWRMIGGILAGVAFGLCGAVLMLVVKVAIDLIFPTGGVSALANGMERVPEALRGMVNWVVERLPRSSPGKVGTVLVVAAIPLTMAVRGVCAYLNYYLMNWSAIRATMDLRHRLFEHLQNLSLDFFHESSTGDLISRIGNDVGVLHKTISVTLPTLVRDPISLVCYLALLFWKQPSLTLVSLVVIPVCVVPIAFYGRKVRRSSEALQTNFAELTSLMEEVFTGIRVVKAYNLEGNTRVKFAENTRRYISHFMRVIRSSEIPGVLIEFLGSIGVGLVFLYVRFLSAVPVTPGDFLQFVGTVFLMYQPMKALGRLHLQLEQARAASRRVFEMLDLHPTVREPEQPVAVCARDAAIEFRRVDFRFGDKTVLHGIDLRIEPGQQVALVGPSGSGKTTLANLLLRFYDPSAGEVRLGGVDLRQVASRDLRTQITVVTQEPILFNDTIRQNIAYGRPGASAAEIEAAARQAHAHEFIMEKPQGYDTLVGEKGITLSGGQRQRIAIARAILRDAPILVLDEATSALDSESERVVQAALDSMVQGRTTICIAHRLSTVQRADRIVVLDQGRIVQQGTHAELIQQDGVYRRLYELQFMTDSPPGPEAP